MPDVGHFFGSDMQVSASGDLLMVDGLDLTTQRLIRRLMTAANAYIWHTDYGAGVPQRIGDNTNTTAIKAAIASQIYKDGLVASNPAPIITTTATFNTVNVHIKYTSRVTGKQEVLSFDVNS